MLDIKFIREHPEIVKESLAKRGYDFNIDNLLRIDEERRAKIAYIEKGKNRINEISREIGELKKKGEEAKIAELREASKKIGEEIEKQEKELYEIEIRFNQLLLLIPNIPHESVVEGSNSSQNPVVKTWGEKPNFSFKPLPHWELGENLGILDFNRGSKISGSGFTVLLSHGARLERALINFMIDLHVSRGYTEILPPFLVNSKSMIGTGQLPKFEEDMYSVKHDDLYLVPTAEVPVTNLHSEEIFDKNELPKKYVAYTPCFRREAGSYGKDVRGLIRQHQFDKVELVKFVEPEKSFEELEDLLEEAEEVLKQLKIHYRVVSLCTGDLGFASAKTYDIEVWLSGQNEYKEISSVSNFTDFQARRANIRYRPEPKAKPQFVHTLNGSGLAIGRTVVAILENYQQADGTVAIPEVLVPYMGGVTKIGG